MKTIWVCAALSAMSCGFVSSTAFDAGRFVEVADAGDAGAVSADAGLAQTKWLFAFERSGSLAVTDSDGARVAALTSLMNAATTETPILVLSFAGTTVQSLSGSDQFRALGGLTSTERAQLTSSLLVTGGDSSTDFRAPLEAIRAAVALEVAKGERSRIEVVFVTDGAPTANQDNELFCNGAVSRIAELSDSKNAVHLNTAFLFRLAAPPACSDSFTETSCEITPPASRCSSAVIASYEARLKKMATLGHGTFRSFSGQNVAVDYGLLLTP